MTRCAGCSPNEAIRHNAFSGIDGDSYADGAGFYPTRAFSMPIKQRDREGIEI